MVSLPYSLPLGSVLPGTLFIWGPKLTQILTSQLIRYNGPIEPNPQEKQGQLIPVTFIDFLKEIYISREFLNCGIRYV